MATITEVINAYKFHHLPSMMNFLNNLHKELGGKRIINHQIAKHIIEGDHQERLIYETKIHYAAMYREVTKRLKSSNLLINSYSNFEDLHTDVENLLLPIKGIGHLTVYDIAYRIGYLRKDQILPEKNIYLYAGALKGANKLYLADPSLFSLRPSDLNSKGEIKEGPHKMSMFKSPLSIMPSLFLEDMLCVFDRIIGKYRALPYSKFQKVPFYYDKCIHA